MSRSAVDHPAKATMALAVLVNVHRFATVFRWLVNLRWVVPIVIHGWVILTPDAGNASVPDLFVRRKAVCVGAPVHVAGCPAWSIAAHYHVGNPA